MKHLEPEIFELLCCPVCKQKLHQLDESRLICGATMCRKIFPIIQGIPILINEQNSVFNINDYTEGRQTTYKYAGRVKSFISHRLPKIGLNIKAHDNFRKMGSLLFRDADKPKVLVVGGGVSGAGMEAITTNSKITFLHTDVALEPQTELICDGHDLPFPDASFDGVIIQAVLEHVLDPYRCIDEIHRILTKGGILYVETPFLQGVHGGKYDFTRFTDLGLRRLCRNFEEIDRGATCGTGMALAGIYLAFLKSLSTTRAARNIMTIFGMFTSFWLKYIDHLSINTAGSLDAASGLFFMGRKSDKTLSDRDLLQLFKGASGV